MGRHSKEEIESNNNNLYRFLSGTTREHLSARR